MATKTDAAAETRVILMLSNAVLDSATDLIPHVNRDPDVAWARISRAAVLRYAVSLGLAELRQRYGVANPAAAPAASGAADEDEGAAP